MGPVPVNDSRGKEVVVTYKTNLNSGDVFHTDANGREYQKRVRNFRPTWNLNVTEPVAGNYYPLTAGMFIEGRAAALSLLTDRAQGEALPAPAPITQKHASVCGFGTFGLHLVQGAQITQVCL